MYMNNKLRKIYNPKNNNITKYFILQGNNVNDAMLLSLLVTLMVNNNIK